MPLPSPRPRQGHLNCRPLPSPQLPCQLGTAQPEEGFQDILWGGKPSGPIPAAGTPKNPLPAHPLRQGAGLVQTDSPPLQSSSSLSAPCRSNQSPPRDAQPASLLLPNRTAPLAFSRLGEEGGGYVLSVFPKRGGAAFPVRCLRTACAVGVAAAVGVVRAEAAVSGRAAAAVRGAGWGSGQGRAGTGPGPRRRSVEGAGKRAETSRRAAGDGRPGVA